MDKIFENWWKSTHYSEWDSNSIDLTDLERVAKEAFYTAKPEWLSLDLAPRDGTKFLVKMESGVIYSNCYYDCFDGLQTEIWDGTSRVIFEDYALFMYNP